MNIPGLRRNARQFALLVVVNAFVGAMVGLERSVLPVLAEDEFGVAARSALLSFIAVFGISKALANYVAGRAGDAFGRKPVLVVGWLLALPVPVALAWAPSWGWIVAVNALLGVSQGLTWSSTVIMKIDLVGPRRRGLAMGLNESAGYVAVAATALATGYLAASASFSPFLVGIGIALVGTALSVFGVRETRGFAQTEAAMPQRATLPGPPLLAVNQAGLFNNLNDGVAWGLFPLIFAAAGLGLERIGVLAAVYPAVWGVGQLGAGALSDRVGRTPLVVAGMVVQAAGLVTVAHGVDFGDFLLGSALLGAGTALTYPTLLAAVGDAATPARRARAVGVYRLWRDSGYAVGALVGGVAADAFGLATSLDIVAGITLLSGLLVAVVPSRNTMASWTYLSSGNGQSRGLRE